mgnify:FL=1
MNTYSTIPTKIISFRLSQAEYNTLLNAANAAGQRIGNFCCNKMLAVAATPEVAKPPPIDSDGSLHIEENIKQLNTNNSKNTIMKNEEPLSHKEFAYIRQQEKSEAINAAQEAKIINMASQITELASVNAELKNRVETLIVENKKLSKPEHEKKTDTPLTENEKVIAEHAEILSEFKLYIKNVELQNEELKKQIEELKTHVPTKEDADKK